MTGGRVERADGEAVRALRADVETALEGLLARELADVPAGAAEPIRYAVLGPGKRFRPLLLLAAYRACGGERREAAELACSVELVHAYSLVHDDLPCMDDDVLRRGRPTVHVAYGVPAAVLAGAALMPMAVGAILAGAQRMGLSRERTRRLVATLARAAGAAGMVGGQLLDLRAEGRDVGRREVEEIHAGKTAELIAASAVMGAIAAGAAVEREEQLGRFGRKLGLAFQAVDDILDIEGTERELGKQSGRDLALRKATLPAVLGIAGTERLSRRLAAEAEGELEGLGGAAELREIVGWVTARRR